MTVSRTYLPSHCSRVTEISYFDFSAKALQTLRVRLNSVSEEGHFILEDVAVFRTYLPSY
jgi:hypothetical protein